MGAVMLSRMVPELEKGCVPKFEDLAWQFSRKLRNIHTIGDFDTYHDKFIDAFIANIKNKHGKECSYGQAQKPINVFLKNYVDRSSLPDAKTAERIRPFLHVPLDSIVMRYLRTNFGSDYKAYITPCLNKMNAALPKINPSILKLPDSEWLKLQNIYEESYLAWQKWLRDIYPSKPVLLDTIWSIERNKSKSRMPQAIPNISRPSSSIPQSP